MTNREARVKQLKHRSRNHTASFRFYPPDGALVAACVLHILQGCAAASDAGLSAPLQRRKANCQTCGRPSSRSSGSAARARRAQCSPPNRAVSAPVRSPSKSCMCNTIRVFVVETIIVRGQWALRCFGDILQIRGDT